MRTTEHDSTEPAHDYPPPPARAPGNARTLAIVGFVLAGVGLLILPILFCPAAVILGVMAMRRGEPLGKWVIVAGVATFLVSLVIAATLLDDVSQSESLHALR